MPVRQRNNSDHPLTVHTDPPQVVDPGQVIDHDDHVIGLTAVDEPAAEPADEPDTTVPAGEQPAPRVSGRRPRTAEPTQEG
jgi:hypothetical protein